MADGSGVKRVRDRLAVLEIAAAPGLSARAHLRSPGGPPNTAMEGSCAAAASRPYGWPEDRQAIVAEVLAAARARLAAANDGGNR